MKTDVTLLHCYNKGVGMHIVYTIDDDFAMQAGVSILSVLSNNQDSSELTIHIVSLSLNEENRAKLTKCVNMYGREVSFYNVSNLGGESDHLFYTTQSWSLTVYIRLFLSLILPPSLERVIYLDADTLVLDSLIELWETELDEMTMVCGVQDLLYNKNMYKYLKLDKDDVYVYSGAILMNMKGMRENNILDRFLRFMRLYGYAFLFPDQDVLNGTLKGMIRRIDAKYNVLSLLYLKLGWRFANRNIYYKKTNELALSVSSPVILHFSGCGNTYRPWFNGCLHPYTKKWLEFKMMSPWRDTPLLILPKVNPFKAWIRPFFWKSSVFSNYYFVLWNSKPLFSLRLLNVKCKLKKVNRDR